MVDRSERAHEVVTAAPTLLALTFVTGIVDAVAFLGLGQVFTAMQTGNVLFLGFGLAGATGAPVMAPLIALGAFVAGGALAALMAAARGIRLAEAMALEVALLASAAAVAALTDVVVGETVAYMLIAVLALAMGLRNTVARRLGGQNLATTVLNVSLAPVTATAAVASEGELRVRAGALAMILFGALAGALLQRASVALAIAAAATITLVALTAHVLAGTPAPRRAP